MPKRTKEEIAEENEKERLRALRRGPDLDRFLEGKKRTFVSYAEGARFYSMNYYSFVTLAKAAGANIRIKKKVVIDLDAIEEYLEKQCIMPRSTPPTEWKAALTVSRTKWRTSLISRGARDWKKRNGMCPKQRTVFKSFVKSVLLAKCHRLT